MDKITSTITLTLKDLRVFYGYTHKEIQQKTGINDPRQRRLEAGQAEIYFSEMAQLVALYCPMSLPKPILDWIDGLILVWVKSEYIRQWNKNCWSLTTKERETWLFEANYDTNNCRLNNQITNIYG